MARPLEGKVAVVTGATSGIGREVAYRLALDGATTVVVGRGDARAEATARQLAAASGNPRVEWIGVSDLALLSEGRRVAHEVRERYPKVGVLVNNAGAYYGRRETTGDGLERTFALNVLAPFVLTTELERVLRAGAPSRVVQVASAAHRGYALDFSDLQSERAYRGFGAYGRSKLALLLLTRELARRWPANEVTVNAVHPGFVRSGFGRNNPGATALAIRVGSAIFGTSVRKGADTPVYVASDPSLAGISGAYFARRRTAPGSAASRDTGAAARLYQVCTELAATPVPEN